jgi:hypothetical protein
MPSVEVEAFLADSVQAAGGKLHALGIGWRVLQAQGVPARHDRIGIGVIVRTSEHEAGAHRLTLTLSGPDGAIGFGAEPDGKARTGLDASFSTPPGEGSATLALNLDGLVFQREGEHVFALSVDGDERVRLPFRVQSAPEPAPTEYRTGVYL